MNQKFFSRDLLNSFVPVKLLLNLVQKIHLQDENCILSYFHPLEAFLVFHCLASMQFLMSISSLQVLEITSTTNSAAHKTIVTTVVYQTP